MTRSLLTLLEKERVMTYHKYLKMLAVLAVPLLVGSQCVVLFSSGTGSDKDDEDKEEELLAVVRTGSLGDTPIRGVYYESGSLSGVTGDNGEFEYEEGKPVRFSIGAIALGDPVEGKALVTELDLVPKGTADTPAVVNLSRLLQSLDAEPDDAAITIPPQVRSAAVKSNTAIASSIEYLDFSDDAAFLNAASQLVAVLGADYPFTPVLVDKEQVRARLE
jgi:hypothetical protein